MSLLNCFARAREMGFITSEEFSQLSERYNQIARETTDTAEARARMQQEIEAEAAHRERAALLTEIARTRVLEELPKYRNARGEVDMLEAWIAMHENFGRIGSFIQDAEGRRETIARKAQADMRVVMNELARGKIMGDLSRTSKWVGSRKQQARMDNMVRELFGQNTDDATAQAMAQAWQKVSEDLRIRLNAAGGSVPKLERWGLPQSHDPLALMDFGQRAWVDHLMQDGVLDRERTVHPLTRRPLSDADLRAALMDIWQKITTDGWSNKDVTAQPPGKGALYTQHMDHRFLHFKDADAWLAYAKRFGNPDAFAAMMGHISVMSRDIAHMEVFGPNPNALRQYVRNHITKMAAEKAPRDVIISEIDGRIRALQQEAFDLNDPPAIQRFDRLRQAVDRMIAAAKAKDDPAIAERGKEAAAVLKEITDQSDARTNEIGQEISKLMGELQQPITVAEGRKRIMDYTSTRLNRADEMWAAMRGVEPGNQYVAEVMQSVRNFISATSLGGAWISSLTDPAFGQDTRMRLGMSFAKANFGRLMVAGLKELFTNGNRQDAIDAMLGLDSAMNVMRQKASEVKGWDHRFWTGWIADRTLTWGLLSPWTQAGKHIVGRDIMTFIGSQVGNAFEALPKGLQAALQTHGIDKAAWDTIRQAPLQDGRRLRPNEIMTLGNAKPPQRVPVNAADIATTLGKGETAYAMNPASVMQPDPYAAFNDWAQGFDGGAGLNDAADGRFQMHGTRAVPGFLNLLDNGIDPSRSFHSGPPKGEPQAGGVASTRTNNPFLIVSEPDRMIRDDGIKNVILQGPSEAVRDALQAAYPDVTFMTLAEGKRYLETGQKPPRPSSGTVDVNARDLGERYLQMILRETRYAVPEGTIASRTLFTGAGKPGTIIGEMARSAGQFKGFGVAVLMLHAGRIAREVGAGNARDALGHGAALIITSTFLGAVAIALKDVRDGRDPRKWLDEKTWLDWKHWGAAFMQAGGLGIYGDLLFSETNRFGGGLESTVAGPLVGRVGDVLGVTAEIKAGLEGKKTNFGRYGVNQLRRNVPFANHWALSLMYQRAVMDRLQIMADPEAASAFARQVSKRRREYGQSAWWPAGAPAPQRAPDLSRVLSSR